MIKNYKNYLKIQKQKRVKHLQNMTLKDSIKVAEGLLGVVSWFKKGFIDDDSPLALNVYLNKLRGNAK